MSITPNYQELFFQSFQLMPLQEHWAPRAGHKQGVQQQIWSIDAESDVQSVRDNGPAVLRLGDKTGRNGFFNPAYLL